MNYLNVIRALFKARPTLEDFVDAHNPTSEVQVQELTRLYNRLVDTSAFYS